MFQRVQLKYGGYQTQYHFRLGQESEDVKDVTLLVEDEDEQERLFSTTLVQVMTQHSTDNKPL